MRIFGQIVAYTLFAAVTGLLSVWPAYRLLDNDQAIISVSFSHAAQRVGECRQLSQQELNELPPNMRKPNDCPRQRFPMHVRFAVDNEIIYDRMLEPSGLWKDGKSSLYRRFPIGQGKHHIAIHMSDSGGDEFDYSYQDNLVVEAGQNVVIGFSKADETFVVLQGRP